MKVKIRKVYYKSIRKGREPARYLAVQPGGLGTEVHAVIRLDPVLKKHKVLRNAIVNHEKYEIYDWGKGCPHAHKHAKHKEPKLTRKMNVKGFWEYVGKR
jgi:hypothetical protein